MNASRGFTIIELVVTMVVSTIVIAFSAMFISAPVQGFVDQARRVRLVDAADSALQRIRRDVRRALPNTVRTASTGSINAIELLSTVDGARYRAGAPGTADQILDFTTTDTSFNTIGRFTQIAKPFTSTSHFLSIYNVAVPGADAYELANVITPAGTTIDIAADTVAGEDRVTLSTGFRFAFESPSQRVFLSDGPITYLCNTAAGTLVRYSGYTIAANQSARDTHTELVAAGATAALMADRVTGCDFRYEPGSAERAAIMAIELQIAEQGETISLLSQVHVDNAP